jgi:hypothetical protein
MKLCSRILAAALLSLVLSACDLSIPTLAAGHVSIQETGRPIRSWPLSPAQLVSLDAWLKEHKSGWELNLASISPGTLVSLQDVRGMSWAIYVRGTTVAVAAREVQLKQSFAAQDIATLLAAIGAT